MTSRAPIGDTAARFNACAKPVIESLRSSGKTKGEPHVLDLGCGSGVLTLPAALMVPEAIFYGLAPDARDVAALKKNAMASDAGNIVPMRFDGTLPDRCATLWGVFSMGFLPTLPADDAWNILRAVVRALIPGALARIEFTDDEALRLLKEWGMDVKSVDSYPFGTFVTARKPL